MRARQAVIAALFLGLWGLWAGGAFGAEVLRAQVEPGVSAVLHDGRSLFIECRVPPGQTPETFFGRLLADPAQCKSYKDRQAVAIPFERLTPEVQRSVLLALFKEDTVDSKGWWHKSLSAGPQAQRELQSFCAWVTGNGANYAKVAPRPKGRGKKAAVESSQRVLIPAALLLDAMKAPAITAKTRKEPQPPQELARSAAEQPPEPEEAPVDLEAVTQELEYGSDAQGPYAAYRLKPGESLYTAVVVRFTDFRDTQSTLKACEVVRKRNGIDEVRNLKAGRKILIPLEMLSDRFNPAGSPQREEYETTVREAKRLRKGQVRTQQLEGIVVIVDPGHGGHDQGAANDKLALYEDEINYDIACRVKKVLETQTRAKVYMTIVDVGDGHTPKDCTTFGRGNGEQLLTTPRYNNNDAKISANLRWYLANSIYRREVKNGTDPRKIVFTSFHTDALYNENLRGAMIYIPGSAYRRETEHPSNSIYAHFKEVRENDTAESTDAERRRDEALSRNFAEDIMRALGNHRIRRHLEGDWIRSKIRQDGGKVYLPAVLRNTLIPTKILIEAANMTNKTDCLRLADPQWRQSFAEAYVDALKAYFGS